MGCVGISLRAFPRTAKCPRSASRARAWLRAWRWSRLQEAYRSLGWEQAVGSSGTIRIIADLIRHYEPSASGDLRPKVWSG